MRRPQQNRIVLIGAALAVLSLIVGVQLGLLLSRSIGPVSLSSDGPASLAVTYKEEYIVMVGSAYALDHDLERARAQLDRLQAPNINQWIANLIDRYTAEGRDEAEVRGLMELAHGLGVDSPPVLAYIATLTPPPTPTAQPSDTPLPTSTAQPSDTPLPPTSTAQPSDTPLPPTSTAQPSDTPLPPTSTAQPSDTPKPQPTTPPKPQPSDTPQPTNPPAAKWTWSARLVGPGEDGQSCNDGLKLIRVTVVDAAGKQIPGVWVYERYTSQYRVTGHKGEDPFWGPGEAEYSGQDGGQMCIVTGEGGPCESEFTRDLPCHDRPPFEDLWAAGYCERCDPGITQERCQQLVEEGKFLGVGHYAWHVEFRRSY